MKERVKAESHGLWSVSARLLAERVARMPFVGVAVRVHQVLGLGYVVTPTVALRRICVI